MSVFYEILVACKERVQTANECPVPKIRKTAELLKEDGSTFPIVFVCPGGPEQVGMEAFNRVVSYEYPVLVVILNAFDRVFEIDVASQLELREAIRNVLYQPTLTTENGSVFNTEIETLAPFFGEQGGAGIAYESTGFRLNYKSTETRTA